MLESAEELHDAVSGTLSNVDLMLQYRSHTLLSAPQQQMSNKYWNSMKIFELDSTKRLKTLLKL